MRGRLAPLFDRSFGRRASHVPAAEMQPFTRRQGEYLAFIHRFTKRRGIAPSFEEIASHFGTTSPAVNGMIKTLEQRGLLSRVPGVARSLQVLVAPDLLPESDYRAAGDSARRSSAPTPADAALAAAIAVLGVLLPKSPDIEAESRAYAALETALVDAGMGAMEAREVVLRVQADRACAEPRARTRPPRGSRSVPVPPSGV